MADEKIYQIYCNGQFFEVSKELHDYYKESQRKLTYAEKDRKQERTRRNRQTGKAEILPSIEDSIDRLTENGVQFAAEQEDVIDIVMRKLLVEKCDEFLRLMRDCRKGKIDRILTKSISRFARNTKDCLEAVRELKSLGVSVYFEKENIDTAEIDTELFLTLYSSFAQEESMSISKNVRMGVHKKMADGSYINPQSAYGYDFIDGKFVINKERAKIVKSIFKMYSSGMGTCEIADFLNKQKAPFTRKAHKWYHTAVLYILKNEKYIGDSLFQKNYISDTLPFTLIKNKGEKPQYYVKNTHSPIVDKELFDEVQRLLKQRENKPKPGTRKQYIFTKKIKCGNCGYSFRRKKPQDKVFWVCKNHDQSIQNCALKQIPETEIKAAFIRLYNKLTVACKEILTPTLRQLQELNDKGFAGNTQIIAIRKEIAETKEQCHMLATLKSQGILDAAYFTAHSQELDRKLISLQKRLHAMLDNDEDDEQ